MPANTKIINRRIKSVVNTRKITKAMELVSASKMRKAVASVLGTRPYSTLAWRLVTEIARKTGGSEEETHPLLTARAEVKRTLAVLITSDRGLCGGFNAQILRVAADLVRRHPEGTVDLITIGKRGEQWARRRGVPIVASFGELTQTPTVVAVRPLARVARDGFLSMKYDEVVVLYTDFVSAIAQKPRSKTLLPLRRDSELGEVGEPSGQKTPNPQPQTPTEYLFEPNPKVVLDRILPRIFETQLYQAILESLASEHSARMLAMRNATDSATEMIDDLRFTFNQARQAGITQEIAEISSGAAALQK